MSETRVLVYATYGTVQRNPDLIGSSQSSPLYGAERT